MPQLYTKQELAQFYRQANPGFGYEKMSDDQVLLDAGALPGGDKFLARLEPTTEPTTKFQQMKDLTAQAFSDVLATPARVSTKLGQGMLAAAEAAQRARDGFTPVKAPMLQPGPQPQAPLPIITAPLQTGSVETLQKMEEPAAAAQLASAQHALDTRPIVERYLTKPIMETLAPINKADANTVNPFKNNILARTMLETLNAAVPLSLKEALTVYLGGKALEGGRTGALLAVARYRPVSALRAAMGQAEADAMLSNIKGMFEQKVGFSVPESQYARTNDEIARYLLKRKLGVAHLEPMPPQGLPPAGPTPNPTPQVQPAPADIASGITTVDWNNPGKYPGGDEFLKKAAYDNIWAKGSHTSVPAEVIKKYGLEQELDGAMFAEADAKTDMMRVHTENVNGPHGLVDFVMAKGFINKDKLLKSLDILEGKQWKGREMADAAAWYVRKNGTMGPAEFAAEAFKAGLLPENDKHLFMDELARQIEIKQRLKRGEDISDLVLKNQDMDIYGNGTADRGGDLAGQTYMPGTGPEMPNTKIRPAEGVDQEAFLQGFAPPEPETPGLFEQPSTPEPPIKGAGRPGNMNIGLLPGAVEAAEAMQKAATDLQNTFAPYSTGTGGQTAARVLRSNLGQMARSHDRADAAMAAAKKTFDNATKDSNLEFIYRMEAGTPQATAAEQKIADTLRGLMDAKTHEVRALGTGKLDHFYENYFPHIWERPETAIDVFKKAAGHKPFQGTKNFLKQRSVESTKKGIELGLTPVSYNPVDLTLLKIREMDRYIMANRTVKALRENGLVKFVKLGQAAPEDFAKINDTIAEVYSRGENGELIMRGRYYAQQDAARIINNYLSPGLTGKIFYDMFRGAGNALNQFQLGFSAFHLGFTSMDATISKVAIGNWRLMHGDVKGAMKAYAAAPFAPVTNFIQGRKLLQAWYGADNPEMTDTMAHIMATAGGRAKMDTFYATIGSENLNKTLQEGRLLTAAFKLPFWIVTQLSKPILEYIVPRQKLGVFMDIMNAELELNPNMTPDEITAKAQTAWDSVDNRMGQLVYDNLFWHRYTKDMAMAATRSLGWNLGTVREVGGGIADAAKYAGKKATGAGGEYTHRMAYVMALPMVAGLGGAIYQYLRTGQGPQEPKDYFFPRTGGIDRNGDPARVSLPTYMKDIYHYKKAPLRTVVNKVSPAISAVAQMLSNKDYYGNEIRNIDDPAVQQALQELEFMGGQLMPFGIRNLNRDTRKTWGSKVEPFIGITPAPYDLNMTPAELKAREYTMAHRQVGARTREQADLQKLKSEFINEYTLNPRPELADRMMATGKFTKDELRTMMKYTRLTPLERSAPGLTVYEVANVLKLAEDGERDSLLRIFHMKFKNQMRNERTTPTEKAELVKLQDQVISEEIKRMKDQELKGP